VSTLVSILGLGLLILVHEAGHFYTARIVGMRPRKFYLGFPPALVKVKRNGIEYGIGSIPLGGYVKIPGMHRPAARDTEAHLARALEERPEAVGAVSRVTRALDAADYETARTELEALERASLSERAMKGVDEVADALSPDAYWRQRTWKRVAVIFAGPGTNLLFAILLFAALYAVGSGGYRLGFVLKASADHATAVVESVAPGHPAATAGLRPGDRIAAIDGAPVRPDAIATVIRKSAGSPLRLTVVRGGHELRLPAASAQKVHGKSPPAALGASLHLTWDVTKQIGSSMRGLVHGQGRKNVSSPVGIVRGSSEALDQGIQPYLSVLGLISLSLALLNLLPLLPLDGGHILFSLIEGVSRRAIAQSVYVRVSAVGIALFLLLFYVGLSNDLGG